MMTLYSLGLLAAAVLTSPWWLSRMAFQQKYRTGLAQRLGRVPASLRQMAAGKRVFWIHAVSVGETLAATSLVKALEESIPSIIVVISTTTRAGNELARQRFGADRVFYFPLDFAFAVRAYLRVLRPELMVLMESELWPRHLHECAKACIPVVVANTRISDRSFPRYMKLRFAWQRLMRNVTLFLAQSEEDARRLRSIGAKNIITTGNLKYDVRAAAETPLTELIWEYLPKEVRVIVAGSTLATEEEALVHCLPQFAKTILILAPRHPERFPEVASLLARMQPGFIRLSEWRKAPLQLTAGTVLLLDSIGELASLYSLATLAFVGGSLIPAGGHNPLEPAQWAVPVAQGPSYENFRGPVEALLAADAIAIIQPENLCAELARLLDSSETKAMGQRAQQVFESQSGATARSVEAITQIIEAYAR